MLPFLFICSSLPAVILAFGSASCYYPNGTLISVPQIQQCSNGVTTTCCALNRPNTPGNETNESGFTQDECLPNGLCQNRYMASGVKATSWWLEYCTNPDPTSSDCLDVCRHTRDATGGSRMTPCGVDGRYNALIDDREVTKWCCGNNDSCCTNNIGVIELPRNFTGHAVTSSVSSSDSSPTSSLYTSSTSSPTSSPAPTESRAPKIVNHELSIGAKAGIGVAASVGVIAILLATIFARKAYKYRELVIARAADGKHALQTNMHGNEHNYAHSGYPPTELMATSPPVELSPSAYLGELPVTHKR